MQQTLSSRWINQTQVDGSTHLVRVWDQMQAPQDMGQRVSPARAVAPVPPQLVADAALDSQQLSAMPR